MPALHLNQALLQFPTAKLRPGAYPQVVHGLVTRPVKLFAMLLARAG